MTNCPDNCDNGQQDELSCSRNCYCGGCTTEYECERCDGRGMVCDCGQALDEDDEQCEYCNDERFRENHSSHSDQQGCVRPYGSAYAGKEGEIMSESTLDDPRCGTCGKKLTTRQLFLCREHFTYKIRELEAKLAASEKRAEAWYCVHEYSMDMAGITACNCGGPSYEACECHVEVEELATKYDAAIDHAHSIDNRRCPECKGNGGHISDGEFAGFVPCPECDGVPWGEVLAEREYQASLPTLTNDKEAGR